MAEPHESKGSGSSGWEVLGALEPPLGWDPSCDSADVGLLARLAEEMYGELAFARAASSHAASTSSRETRGNLSRERPRFEERGRRGPNALTVREASIQESSRSGSAETIVENGVRSMRSGSTSRTRGNSPG